MNETRRARPGPAARRLWASAMLIAFAAIADGMRGEQAQASEPPKRGDVTARDDAERGEQRVSAPALMCGVYDSLAWIDSAASVRIVTRYQTTPTQDEAQWRAKQPRRGLMVGNQEPDARTYCVDSEWAWDEKRIRHCTESYYDGDDAASSDLRVWNGSMAIDFSESADKQRKQYVFGAKAGQFFEHEVTHMLLLAWGPGDARRFWWNAIDVADFREKNGTAPEDFELAGEEELDGRRCHVVETRVGGYRMHIGASDGRLYQRTWLLVPKKSPAYGRRILYKKIAGPDVGDGKAWNRWVEGLDSAAQRKAWRDLKAAEFDFARPVFHHTLDDYREVAPGCWMPFHQAVDSYNIHADEPYLASHIEQNVTEVTVNQPLAEELFQIELVDGVLVTTDWRYDPWIAYVYSKEQTEDERVSLSEKKRALEKKQAAQQKKRGEAAANKARAPATPAKPD